MGRELVASRRKSAGLPRHASISFSAQGSGPSTGPVRPQRCCQAARLGGGGMGREIVKGIRDFQNAVRRLQWCSLERRGRRSTACTDTCVLGNRRLRAPLTLIVDDRATALCNLRPPYHDKTCRLHWPSKRGCVAANGLRGMSKEVQKSQNGPSGGGKARARSRLIGAGESGSPAPRRPPGKLLPGARCSAIRMRRGDGDPHYQSASFGLIGGRRERRAGRARGPDGRGRKVQPGAAKQAAAKRIVILIGATN